MDIKIEVTLPDDVPVHPWSSQVKPEEHEGEVLQGPGKSQIWRNFLSRGEETFLVFQLLSRKLVP